jgi:hypothetical protein
MKEKEIKRNQKKSKEIKRNQKKSNGIKDKKKKIRRTIARKVRHSRTDVAISHMKTKIFLVVLTTILAGCAAADVQGQGVSGSVLLGPHCPVVQEGEECPDTPFQTELVVTSTGGMDEIKEFSSDAGGMFAVLLPVGQYAIRSPQGATLPYCTSDIFAVAANQMTEIIVVCDTGIR